MDCDSWQPDIALQRRRWYRGTELGVLKADADWPNECKYRGNDDVEGEVPHEQDLEHVTGTSSQEVRMKQGTNKAKSMRW